MTCTGRFADGLRLTYCYVLCLSSSCYSEQGSISTKPSILSARYLETATQVFHSPQSHPRPSTHLHSLQAEHKDVQLAQARAQIKSLQVVSSRLFPIAIFCTSHLLLNTAQEHLEGVRESEKERDKEESQRESQRESPREREKERTHLQAHVDALLADRE